MLTGAKQLDIVTKTSQEREPGSVPLVEAGGCGMSFDIGGKSFSTSALLGQGKEADLSSSVLKDHSSP